jgi:Cu(I)/Ag(I) efflux system membrane fusion protein
MSTPGKVSAALCLLVLGFAAGYLANRHQAASASSSSSASRQVLYWACPMHPQYKSDHPGDAPCCGMRLEPVYAAAKSIQAGVPEVRGTVEVSAARQQLIGVRTDEVRRASIAHVLRVPGRIAVDDTRLYRLIAAADGWIRELGPNPAGAQVKQNQVLASYYVRDLLAAEQTYLYALQTSARLEPAQVPQRTPPTLNLRLALDTLRGLGMSDLQIEEMRQTQNPAGEVRVYSPAAGFVLARNVSPGQRFDKGTEMYRIADLGHVWVLADIFEKDRGFVQQGSRALLRYRGRRFEARMSDALPQFDPQTRTLKTRFELDNSGYLLRPDMFVDVEVEVNLPPAVTVPADAVIDSGLRKTVYIDRGRGFFEPRLVETGWRLGDRVQITRGLEPGERIVVGGNFLLDSESRMRLAAASTAPAPEKAAPEKDPVCGMEVDPKAPDAIKTEHHGKTYYFCSDHCKKSFEANPEKYLTKKSLADNGGGPGPA